MDLPDSAPQANDLIAGLSSRARQGDTVKGIGKIVLWDGDGMQASRAAWAGVTDGRIRIEMLGLPGQPVAKIIYDGKDYVFVSPLEQKTYRKSAADADLKSLTGVPVAASDIVQLLVGSIPVRSHDAAVFQAGPAGCGNYVVLKKKWQGVVEKLVLNERRDRVVGLEMYHWGRIAYRVTLKDFQIVNGREIPFRLIFSDADHTGFSIDVEKTWTGVEIPMDMFVIESP